VDAIISGITELLPATEGDAGGPVSGTVFKIDRGAAGEKIAYVRMFSGTLRTRDRLPLAGGEAKITAINVFERGSSVQRSAIAAGQIGKLWGLAGARIGDAIGESRAAGDRHHFAPPTLETVVSPLQAVDRGALRVALDQLAEQDPLINVRQDDVRQETYVSLYGEVQKEVIQETLAVEYGIQVGFHETSTICIERPLGPGEAGEVLYARTKTNVTGNSSPLSSNPFLATVGLRLDPAPIGSGIEFRLDVDVRLVPIYIYKTVDAFVDHMARYVRDTLQQGLFGWQVTDCTVTMIDCGYRAPGTKSTDFRKLTPLILMSALKQAGTVVCEPLHRFRLETTAEALTALLPALAKLDAVPEAPVLHGESCVIEGEIAAARVQTLRQQLAALTRGDGVMESSFERHHPSRGTPPTRRRTDDNPLDRKEYLLRVLRRV
jgi:ribosomal protection tetracycline resistance protein